MADFWIQPGFLNDGDLLPANNNGYTHEKWVEDYDDLTCKMARSSIQDDHLTASMMAQSSLYGLGNKGFSEGSGGGSPEKESPSDSSSQLYAAARQIEGIREAILEQNLLAARIEQVMLLQMLIERGQHLQGMIQETKRKNCIVDTCERNRKQRDSRMRPVFLGSPGKGKSFSSGTGVFLPSPARNASDKASKKSGCSTILLPMRVVHALNLDIKEMCDKHGASGVSLKLRSRNMSREKRNFRTYSAANADHSLRMRRDRTY